jgi:hypothetical protein
VAVLKLLVIGFLMAFFAAVLFVKLITKMTGGYNSTEHLVLNGLLLVSGSMAVASAMLL